MPSLDQQIGFGTWQNTDHQQCRESVMAALEAGYRHIDTAQLYENETAVGEAIEDSPVDREDITVATKLWPGTLAYDAAFDAVEESRKRLGVETIDLLYVHWPAEDYNPAKTLQAFHELREAGQIKAIGVSNFTQDLLADAQKACDSPIVANQVEFHPLLYQDELLKYCTTNDITLVAYSPLARGEVFQVPELRTVAEKHGVSQAQVSLAWLQSKEGVLPIPKATSEAHIRDNFASTTLELDPSDIDLIESIPREKRFADRDWVDW